MMRSSSFFASTLVLATSLLAGCHSHAFEYARLDQEAVDPNAAVSFAGIEIPEGETATARLRLFGHDDEQLVEELRSDDPSTVAVKQTLDDATYTFLGVKRGTTAIHVFADGVEVKIIQAVVTAQSAQ